MKTEHIVFLARKFNLVLLGPEQNQTSDSFNFDLVNHGVICDFSPDAQQIKAVSEIYDKVNLRNSLFTYDQMENMDIVDKIDAQLSEYMLSYGLGGAFIRTRKKKHVKIMLITGADLASLRDVIKRQISRKLALKSEDISILAEIISIYAPEIDIKAVSNNELRVKLLSSFFAAGKLLENVTREDLVRFITFTYTGSTLLIKSNEVISTIKESEEKIAPEFLFQNRVQLAECFNRFKPIFLALKKSSRSNAAINTISRLSKYHHIPVGMPKSRTFIADFLREPNYSKEAFNQFSIFDKFRILNAIALQKSDLENDVFQIRNGKIWFQKRKTVRSQEQLEAIERYVLSNIKDHLLHLKNHNIKLPHTIRYGLPISEKQTIGKLPFGTVITTFQIGKTISVGIYWQNDWGARDLDLSLIDISGQRTGWGDAASFMRDNIKFSGDITNAPEGAMEFMTVTKSSGFGLFVNIFDGAIGSSCKLIIGEKNLEKNHWIDRIYIDEKTSLDSRGNILGFVTPDNDYIVYKGRLGSSNVSSPKHTAIIGRALTKLWTVNGLFKELNLKYNNKIESTFDLSYENMSFEKLANLFEQS